MHINKGRISTKEFGIGQRLSGPRKTQGSPPKKKKRKTWYAGLPLIEHRDSNGKLSHVSSIYSES